MSWLVKMFEPTPIKNAVQEIERVRNMLAFLLVGTFVSCLPALLVVQIPKTNETIITYMVGQLSGMALTVIGFYFVSKVGQDAVDAKRVDTTNKMADAITAAIAAPAPIVPAADAVEAANRVADAAVVEAADVAGENH
jgi:hypothetical protein